MTEEKHRQIFCNWGQNLQKQICQVLENLEKTYATSSLPSSSFTFTSWKRDVEERAPSGNGGGGQMGLLEGGAVFEKFGVNFSEVFGTFSHDMIRNSRGEAPEKAKDDLKGDTFWASGVSLVGHPRNPFVPGIHLNVRRLATRSQRAPEGPFKTWVGGGVDLTPTFPFPEDTSDFFEVLRKACDSVDPTYFLPFKEACDRYFYLPHRQEPRGVGGIFFDNIFTHFETDFSLLKAVAAAFLDIYPQLVHRHQERPWTRDEKQKQLVKRGRYVEFNLLYDRGTQFGLKTGGHTEAILMSLPPLAAW